MHLTPIIPPMPPMPNLEIVAGIIGVPVLLMGLVAGGVLLARWLTSQRWFPTHIGFGEPDDFVATFIAQQDLALRNVQPAPVTEQPQRAAVG